MSRAFSWVESRIDVRSGVRDGWYPEMGNMIPGAGFSAGLGYRHRLFGDQAIADASAAVSWNGSRTLQSQLTWPRLVNERLSIGGQLTYQDFTQIKHPEVLAAIRNAGIKVLFYVEKDDREKVVRQMFGGDVPLTQAVWEVGKLTQKEAYIRIGSQNHPRKTRIPDLPDLKLSDKLVDAFKRKLYAQPWYKDKRTIYDEINARFKPEPRTVRPQQPGDSREHRQPTRGRSKAAKDPATSDDGANREAGPGTAKGRKPFRSAFSEEQD